MRRWALAALASAATLHGAFASAREPVTLEVEPWPAARDCDTCVPIQFGTLELRLPLDDVGKLLVLSAGLHPALHILPKSGEVTEGLMLLVLPPDKVIKQQGVTGELKKLGITTNEQFFDRLGKTPNGNKTLSILRRAYDIEAASRYTKASKDGLHAYWVQPSGPIGKGTYIENAVYFVVEGSDTAYLLSGVITQAVYETLLANARVTKIP
jgi:hypothetical protein